MSSSPKYVSLSPKYVSFSPKYVSLRLIVWHMRMQLQAQVLKRGSASVPIQTFWALFAVQAEISLARSWDKKV